jgi:hypothetical protein
MAAETSAAVPATAANTARGYCAMKNGTVPANSNGKSVTTSLSAL